MVLFKVKENPTGYDEFYALWAFLSHSIVDIPASFLTSGCCQIGSYLTVSDLLKGN